MSSISEQAEGSGLVGRDRAPSTGASRRSPSGRQCNEGEIERNNSAVYHTDSEISDSTTPLLQRSGAAKRPKASRTCFLFGLLVPLFMIAILIGVFRSHPSLDPGPFDQASSLFPNATLSNGTHTFRRTVVLISLDGAKPSYLDSGNAPQLQSLGTTSSHSRRARFMQAIFPTLTFPNHWALLTGLYASSHGIVANDFTAASSGKQFYYTNPAQSWDGDWWLGEPIWATSQRSGIKTAVFMWPGPPVTSSGIRPSYFQKYTSGPEWNLDGRLRQVLEWIDIKNVDDRPSLICTYVPDIDQAAHRYGPESTQAIAAVKAVDAFIGKLRVEMVEKRALGDIVDIVVVSDHGMTTTSKDKLIFLDDLLGPELYHTISRRDGWPSAGLRFKGTTRTEQQEYAQQTYEKLSKVQGTSRQGWDLYWRQDLPDRYHLNSPTVKDRLAPLWVVPKLGCSITTHSEMASFTDGVYAPVGNHGYDNQERDMHAIFVASGPSFASIDAEQGKESPWNMDGFQNVEVHNLVSRILGVPDSKRASTNGTWTFWDSHLRAGL